MPTYVYENKRSGHRIERSFMMSQAPRKVRFNGRRYERIITVDDKLQQLVYKPTVHNLQSKSLPKNWPYAKRFDDTGNPVFSSRREISECLAKANDHGEQVAYDD